MACLRTYGSRRQSRDGAQRLASEPVSIVTALHRLPSRKRRFKRKISRAEVCGLSKVMEERGAWQAQWVEHVALDLGVVSSRPTLGIEITLKKKVMEQVLKKAHGICGGLCGDPSCPPSSCILLTHSDSSFLDPTTFFFFSPATLQGHPCQPVLNPKDPLEPAFLSRIGPPCKAPNRDRSECRERVWAAWLSSPCVTPLAPALATGVFSPLLLSVS